MSAFEEMSRTGKVGRETFDLFVWHLAPIAWRHGFPPPDGATKWSHDVCVSWVQDFFAKKGPEVAVKLFYGTADQASFTRVVRTAIGNELKDQAKATTAGKLRSRMRTLLEKVPDFLDATALYAQTPAWTLEGLAGAIYQGDWMELLTSPDLKLIEPIRKLNTAGPTSRENAEKLVNAARIIIRAAGGAIRDQDLANALVHLFELDEPDIFLSRNDDTDEREIDRPLAPEEYVEATAAADQIILQLSNDEGRALLVLEEPLAVAAAFLPHVADIEGFLDGVRAKLQDILGDEMPPRGSLNLVLDWYRQLPDT